MFASQEHLKRDMAGVSKQALRKMEKRAWCERTNMWGWTEPGRDVNEKPCDTAIYQWFGASALKSSRIVRQRTESNAPETSMSPEKTCRTVTCVLK